MRVLLSGLLLAGFALVIVAPPAGADDVKTEPGFTSLFNGKDLTGWALGQKGGEALSGKTATANNRFQVLDGKLVVDYKSKGNVYIHTTKEFAKDVIIKFEYLPGEGCNNDVFIRGTKFDLNPKMWVKNMKLGEWNQFEIIVQGEEAEFKNNGETQRTIKTKPGATPFVLRAEFGPIQFRNIQYKEGS
ncbi:MAG: DUF1080 domain-containing protein [Gemmataceae bacterium]